MTLNLLHTNIMVGEEYSYVNSGILVLKNFTSGVYPLDISQNYQ